MQSGPAAAAGSCQWQHAHWQLVDGCCLGCCWCWCLCWHAVGRCNMPAAATPPAAVEAPGPLHAALRSLTAGSVAPERTPAAGHAASRWPGPGHDTTSCVLRVCFGGGRGERQATGCVEVCTGCAVPGGEEVLLCCVRCKVMVCVADRVKFTSATTCCGSDLSLKNNTVSVRRESRIGWSPSVPLDANQALAATTGAQALFKLRSLS